MKHTKHFNHVHRINNYMNNYAMKHRMTQEEVLQLVQQAGDKVAEAMNIITDVGARFGINVHFDQIHFDQTRRSNQPANKMANRAGRSNRAANGASDNDNNNENNDDNENNESSEVLVRLSTGTSDMLSDEEMTNIVTIPDLAEMISDETDIKEECALEVLEAAFDLIEEYGLILDLGSWDRDDDSDDDDSDNYDYDDYGDDDSDYGDDDSDYGDDDSDYGDDDSDYGCDCSGCDNNHDDDDDDPSDSDE